MRVQDCNGNEIKVGTKVIYGAPEPGELPYHTAEVIEISEPDVVYNPLTDADDGGYDVVIKIGFEDGECETVRAPIVGSNGLWITDDAEEVFEEGGDLEVIV